MRDYTDRRVALPTWGPPPPCKQALINEWLNIFRLLLLFVFCLLITQTVFFFFALPKSKRKRFNRNRVDMILNSANVNGFWILNSLITLVIKILFTELGTVVCSKAERTELRLASQGKVTQLRNSASVTGGRRSEIASVDRGTTK